ncbi:MAG: hypothetical protein Q4D34_07550, partial [Eggerthellaceae bacterium]|nr:hypothetical protein [Eggerthellaceae bacterium]
GRQARLREFFQTGLNRYLLELPLPDGQRGAQGHASATPASISALKGFCTLALAVSSATSFPRVSACVVKWMRADQIAR